jgi:hypothetical protein
VTEQKSEWVGFPQKAALGAFGILFTLLVGYFIWLGTTIVEVRQKVIAIEASVKALNESRREQADAKAESNKQRIDALEEEGEGTE